MSRIDAAVATQVGDAARPRQSVQQTRQQTQQAQVADAQKAASDPNAKVAADDLHAIAAQMRQVVEIASGKRLAFKIYDDSQSVYVEISDQNTGEVIKQMPSAEMLRMRSRLDEMIGMMVDRTA